MTVGHYLIVCNHHAGTIGHAAIQVVAADHDDAKIGFHQGLLVIGIGNGCAE